ncbi:MAG: DUF6465 family protein [Lachnospiraceae bacterium]|nr:DUF6465 family protein [Lachnospiraceae bacterium]
MSRKNAKTNTTKNASVNAATKALSAAKKNDNPVVAPKVETKAAVVKEEVKKTEEKKADTKAPVASKAKAEEKKPVAAKAPAKKAEAKKTTKRAKKPVEKVQEVFVEYGDQQYLTQDVIAKIHEKYKAEGHRVGAIKSLRVYINPEQGKAFYVINDKANGEFVEL